MTHFHRHSIRLPGYDYTRPGAYFVTMKTYRLHRLFGEIVGEEMHLNEYGRIVEETWYWLSSQYPYILLPAWIVMPDHVHGIILIQEPDSSTRGGSRPTPSGRTKPLG